MKRPAIFALVIAGAAACSQSGVQLQPGQWEITMTVTGVQAPGASAEMLAQLRAAIGQPQVMTECLTPEQAADPKGWLQNPGAPPQNCTFTDQTLADGVIRVASTCPLPDGGSTRATLEGSYTATTMEARGTGQIVAGSNAPPDMPRTISTSGPFTARRIGDCPAAR
ncbi:MAG TPA: DUF3617 domain-containing protein [Allosphingosinicella sp.]|nr:DUF3617 domain-containing protein [Allosphingosinicella sp.]